MTIKNSFRTFLLSLIFLFFSGYAFAEQKIVEGDYHIHYSVFPSTALSPVVASQYNLVRSQYRAVINITPQRINADEKSGAPASVTGTRSNLIGNTSELDFREITEGEVVYYIADFPFSNEEHFRFSIAISPDDSNGKSIPLTFEKKFYRE